MLISKMVDITNAKLAGELFTLSELTPYFDDAIDDINTKLNTCFPTITEFLTVNPLAVDYDCFPDKYIRTVLITGALYYFYTMDEEGISASPEYKNNFLTNLFYMERDYITLVPEQYIADTQQGAVAFSDKDIQDRGLKVDAGVWFI